MAAFEKVSRLTLQPHNRQSIIDLRTTRLPSDLTEENDYDPKEHREPKNPIKVWMAYFNLLRTGFGAGVLGLPLAISQAGMILGPILAFLTGLLIVHMHLILIMDWKSSTPALLSLLIPYLLLEFCMKNLKVISYVSLIGNLLNLIGLILVFYHIFKDPHGGEMIFGTMEALPLLFAFGTFLFNLSAVGVILSLDKALIDPRRMITTFGVVRVGMLVPITISTIFGSLGYWSFGMMEENVLRSLPYDDDSAMAAIGIYLVAIAFAFPIQCYPAITIIVDIIKNHTDTEFSDTTLKVVEAITRPVFVLLAFGVCYLIPFQGPFVAFVGNLCTTMLVLVFPAMMEISLMYPGPYGKYNVYMIKDIFIIILGCVSWVFGVILCGYLIYVRFMAVDSPNNTEYLR